MGSIKKPHPFLQVRLGPISPALSCLRNLEEVKFELASIKLNRPIDNLSQGEQNALKELLRDKNIELKKANKGTTTVIMNKTDKFKGCQVQLDDIHNYWPLDKPIVGTTAKRVHHLIQSLLHRASGGLRRKSQISRKKRPISCEFLGPVSLKNDW